MSQITYSWNFTAFDCYPQAEGETDVVFTIHYTYLGTDGEHTASVYSTVPVTYQAGDPYIPFNELTPEIVTGWTVEALGAEQVAAMQTNIAGQIEQQINPSQVTLPPPWTTPQQ